MVKKPKKFRNNFFNTEKLAYSFAILFLVIIILFLPLRLNLFNEQFYYKQFEKNGVYDKLGEAESKLILDNLLNFFKDKEELKYFKENETSHMIDVRNIINEIFSELKFSFIAFVLLIAYLYYSNKKVFKERFFKILFLSGLISFSFLILLLLAALNFSILFAGFHTVFFPQGNFMFPSDSLLIILFPEVFFNTFLIRIIVTSFFLSGLFMIFQLVINRKNMKIYKLK